MAANKLKKKVDKLTGKSSDVADVLSVYQVRELKKLASEPIDKDTITLEEFKKAMAKWRTNNS